MFPAGGIFYEKLMLKFIHATDTHLLQSRDELHGIAPNQRLVACFTHIRAHHPDTAFVAVTGDVAERGEYDAYLFMREQARRFALPVLLVPGNHDCLPAMQAVFPTFSGAVDALAPLAYLAGRLRTSGGTFLFLDTSAANVAHGVFAQARAAKLSLWMEETYDDIFLFMHHPPFRVGIPFMDSIRLIDPEPLYAALLPYKNSVRHIFLGHLHKSVAGVWRSIPFSVARSTVHQVRAKTTPYNGAMGCDEEPEYSVVTVSKDSIICRAERFAEKVRDFPL